MPRFAWSPDARVMVRPAQTFSNLASAHEPPRQWMAWRRPLAIAGLAGCVISLVVSGVLTLRVVVPSALAWSYVPLIQVLALVIVTWSRRRAIPMTRAIDVFLTAYGPWTLYLIGLAATLAFLPPVPGWGRVRVWLGVMAVVVVWSAWLDFWFFRVVYRARALAAIRDVVVVRLISWTLIFWIFAVPTSTPLGVVQEVVLAVRELSK